MTNYPPGVTGNEPEIAGPYHEYMAWRYCRVCERNETHDVTQMHFGDPEQATCRGCYSVSELPW